MKAERSEVFMVHVPVAKATGHGGVEAERSEVFTPHASVARPEAAA